MTYQSRSFFINGVSIGPNDPPYCIAEVGINHNGDVEIAKKMVEVAKDAGADAVKFQTFSADEFCGDPNQLFTYKSQGQLVTEPMVDMFRRCELPKDGWAKIKKHSKDVGITFFSTPQNPSDLDFLLNLNVPAIKVGSDDFTNTNLLRRYAESNLPLILSCGMADIAEVHQALSVAGWYDGKEVALLLCTSQYPTPPKDVNIKKINTLRSAFPGLLVGFSDHTQGSLAAALAISQGARIFEKHFTLDNQMVGPDHWFSDNPESLSEWIKTIHTADKMLGSPFIAPTVEEQKMRIVARRSIVALRDIVCGEIFDNENIGLRRPGGGVQPSLFDMFLSLKAVRNIRKGEKLSIGDGVR